LYLLPYHDLLWSLREGRREEPEEELAGLIWTVRDGQQASIGLANVERYFRDTGAIDRESCFMLASLHSGQ